MQNQPFLRLALVAALLLASVRALHAYDNWFEARDARQRIVRLDGAWRFSIGDGTERAAPDFDDSGWTTIHAPDTWQDEGYRGYNGFAWYRKSFDLPSGAGQRSLVLDLGRIDDVDEVFVNGHRIGGTGQFPPDYQPAYDAQRRYPVPSPLLRFGRQNVIAVRVFDGGGVGGIVSGRLGLFSGVAPQMEIPLEGAWLFSAGDNPDWKKSAVSETGFRSITVPLTWESAGYPTLDGYAWYRKTFTVSRMPSDQTLVLLLGKIDDYDEVFLNGVAIGRTGAVDHPGEHGDGRSYAVSRAYYFPASLLQESNTLAVRVYDAGGYGGIYAGPVGILSQTEFVKYWESRRHHTFDTLIRWFRSDDD